MEVGELGKNLFLTFFFKSNFFWVFFFRFLNMVCPDRILKSHLFFTKKLQSLK